MHVYLFWRVKQTIRDQIQNFYITIGRKFIFVGYIGFKLE